MSNQVPPRITSSDVQRAERIPPGQTQTRKWPVLHEGATPQVELATWSLRLFGRVEQTVEWSWEEFRALPRCEVLADMHCVTRWSRLDMVWTGVQVREVMRHVRLLADARYVLAHCERDFTTNLPLADFLEEDALLAWAADGEDLDPDHGWPLRLVIPRLYAWKSAKWIRGLEFLTHDQAGYWERGGYHMHGDPWAEERFRD